MTLGDTLERAKISKFLGADSLDTFELMMAFEEFGIEIPDDQAEMLVMVGDALTTSRRGFLSIIRASVRRW